MDLEMVIYLLLVLLQGTCGTGSSSTFSFSEDLSPAEAAASHRSLGAPLRPRRFKRCSCSSLMDKECVYFCHLDIIWINTPEKTVPYGLGGPRLKRSLQDLETEKLPESTSRCICAKHEDKKCLDFCQAAADLSVQPSLEREKGQQEKSCNGLRLGGQCVQRQHHTNTKRMDDLRRSINRSFAIARLLKKFNEVKNVAHPWAHRKRGIWKDIETAL
ncbi:endothelin-1 [Mixophyes fleayi]|uniref:endothelin-1 n=1 Tax=Mixophyes fleayi TaxID=3061075 RepID=UPI003F4DE418